MAIRIGLVARHTLKEIVLCKNDSLFTVQSVSQLVICLQVAYKTFKKGLEGMLKHLCCVQNILI